jgi:chromosome segregation protein
MLKRLELVGFKSFAEKTAFEFSAGVTAVVGPNGSGKSNLVDAVRWILGEQSAKSLRGGEMADVIFNGSATRRSLGLAEVTMTFDNARRQLATDAGEVQITRRVYRDGEGEYLINQQICRLKDIKDLFLGSGAGADAYSIIEQGRVEAFLQSSTKERRGVFEEAAGISRFRSRKVETLRKLERVDQNVQRLRDIIDEVEKQLRSVKLQASKAERYQEHSARLKELRVELGLQEYHLLSRQLRDESACLEGARAGMDERAAQVAAWESQTMELEEKTTRLDDALRQQEALLGAARQEILAQETTQRHERSLAAEHEGELGKVRGKLTELQGRVAELADSLARAGGEVRQSEVLALEERQSVRSLEELTRAAGRRVSELAAQLKGDQDEHLEQMRHVARLQNDVVGARAAVDNLRRERERLRLRTEQASENLASLDQELEQWTQADEALQARLAASREALLDQRRRREQLRQSNDATAELISKLRAERSGLASRIEVLEGLERRHEGLGSGVREVYDLAQGPDAGPWQTVVGLLADFLTVRREHAPLIDLALGDRAQRFLVRDPDALAEALRRRGQPFSGRVSFLPLAAAVQGPVPEPPTAPPSHQGVVARADQLVTCEHPELADLPSRLLGRTLIVRDLATAREIAAWTTGFRLVTLQGELLDADGTLTVGTHHAESGILSRKSELRELRERMSGLESRASAVELDLADRREQLAVLDSHLVQQQQEIDVLVEQATDLRSRITSHRDRRQGLHEEVTLSQQEILGLEQEIGTLEGNWHEASRQAATAEARVHELHARMEDAEQEIRQREHERQQHQQQCTTASVALAKVEERLSALQTRYGQFADDLNRRRDEFAQAQAQRDTLLDRLREGERLLLQASSVLSQAYREKEQAEGRSTETRNERQRAWQRRAQLNDLAQTVRGEWRQQQERVHAHELQANDLRHRIGSLCDRLREDYQLELAELYPTWEPPSAGPDEESTGGSTAIDPAAAQEEIAELRRKLSRLGSVNLDALQELQELQARASDLHTQFADLTTAKRSLEEIIERINADSRRLFAETFTAVKGHFQELFRKLFGGGMADVVLEDENDILECGIEIIAKPPGKELRSISLMSGGEKTLTTVALLLSIFRSKPSPFCILDEVDAALDEANIGRFTLVLKEFLDLSQFIIITHSKRTMAAADVLYGVTMQESGVSRRVAVRFEDWPDEHSQPVPALPEGNGQESSGH